MAALQARGDVLVAGSSRMNVGMPRARVAAPYDNGRSQLDERSENRAATFPIPVYWIEMLEHFRRQIPRRAMVKRRTTDAWDTTLCIQPDASQGIIHKKLSPESQPDVLFDYKMISKLGHGFERGPSPETPSNDPKPCKNSGGHDFMNGRAPRLSYWPSGRTG
jgi:hypothetical protein